MTPSLRLSDARHQLTLASERCPHWDYEDGPARGHACCNALLDAQDELRLARQASPNP